MKRVLVMAVALLASVVAPAALGQAYPSKVVRIVSPTPAGSSSDVLGRVLTEELHRDSGHTFIVENRPGALGAIAADVVAHAPPDGHTFLISSISTHAQAPFLVKNLRYDPVTDFEPVCRLALFQWLIVSDPALGFASVKDLIAAAKAAPGKLTFAYGAASALAGISEFNKMAGIEALGVAYKGQPLALNDIMGGRVSYMLVDVNVSAPLINSEKIKGLAVTNDRRSPLIPNVPTFPEAGMPVFEFIGWTGLSAPAKTPPAVVRWMSDRVQAALARREVADRLNGIAIIPAHLPPAEFNAFMQRELSLWGRRIKAAGIQPE